MYHKVGNNPIFSDGWFRRTTSADLGGRANGLRWTELVLDLARWYLGGREEERDEPGRGGRTSLVVHSAIGLTGNARSARRHPANQTVVR